MSKAERVSRRKVLAGAAALLGSSVVSGKSEAQDGRDPTKVQGRLASEIGQRSRFEQPQRTVPGAGIVSFTPLQDLEGIITPADLHFERYHAGVPDIDPNSYSPLIHGMVKRPTIFNLADISAAAPSPFQDSITTKKSNYVLYQPDSKNRKAELLDPIEFLARVLIHIPQPNRR